MRGSCLCSAVTFEASGPLEDPAACHCGQCRKQSGHFWAAVPVAADGLTVTGEVRWYKASPEASRGFCPICGSFLFWTADGSPTVAVALGALEAPTGLTLDRHIFVADKGDYYSIPAGDRQEDTVNG
jgi:hypothetical protein